MTSEDSGASLGVELLHALLIGSFARGGGSLVGLHPRNVVGIVDVP